MIQALTPGQWNLVVNTVSIAFIMIGVPFIILGAGGVIDRLRRLLRKNEQLITAPPSETCLYCRGIDWLGDCTCDQRCTAMVCIAPPLAKGPGR